MVLYMFSSFWLLGVQSLDFSQAEKERTVCKAEQIHIIRPTHNDNYFQSRQQPRTTKICYFVKMLSFASSSFFVSMGKITGLNSQQPKTRGHVEHLCQVIFMNNGYSFVTFILQEIISCHNSMSIIFSNAP